MKTHETTLMQALAKNVVDQRYKILFHYASCRDTRHRAIRSKSSPIPLATMLRAFRYYPWPGKSLNNFSFIPATHPHIRLQQQ